MRTYAVLSITPRVLIQVNHKLGVQSKANMESVRVLPEPNTLVTGDLIYLFGLLSQSKAETQQECHFCMEPIIKDMLFTMDTPCCHKAIHCKCFETWSHTPFELTCNLVTLCAYCRANYTYPCFLCFKEIAPNENPQTTGCQTTLHKECLEDLIYVLTNVNNDPLLECGHLGCGLEPEKSYGLPKIPKSSIPLLITIRIS